jgi:large subunit ribosomal protein L29
MNKAADKFRNLSPAELKQQEREQMDQLFRLKFQMKMGQSESLNKIRTLRRNVARLKTISRQHQLGITPAVSNVAGTGARAETTAEQPAAKTKAAARSAKPAAMAKSAVRKTAVKKAGKK